MDRGAGLPFIGDMRRVLPFLAPVILAACSFERDTAPGARDPSDWPWHSLGMSGPVNFRADVVWDPAASIPLQTVIEAHNPSAAPLLLETGPCGFGIRAYDRSTPTGRWVWDDRPRAGVPCLDLAVTFTVDPRSTGSIAIHELRRPQPASLPPEGRYHFAVVFRDAAGVHIVPAGETEITAPAR